MNIVNKNEIKKPGYYYIEFNTINYTDLIQELGHGVGHEFSFVRKISDVETHYYTKCKNTGIWVKGIEKLNK